jgi:hypothetical protein
MEFTRRAGFSVGQQIIRHFDTLGADIGEYC